MKEDKKVKLYLKTWWNIEKTAKELDITPHKLMYELITGEAKNKMEAFYNKKPLIKEA
ncbi:hypothetical protein JHD50_09270 [Sulfurimonas sp. MAG313]|nr:hypothetical protein [Sulfurimonas sp. MAG313]MDF1881488.1 hypothetical protein [Sulfurimonas sp. MAG313]